MAPYYQEIKNKSKLKIRSGTAAVVPPHFHTLSSMIISRCSFLQGEIQNIIYLTHGSELVAAKQTLDKFPSPIARVEFLTSFPYSQADPVVSSVFNHARIKFLQIYKLRNILAHENWMSSEEFKDVVLFSKLNESAKITMASRKLLHDEKTTPQVVFDATIRYISKVKIVSVNNLNQALKDADLCSWILMMISHVMGETDQTKKEELRKAFRVFNGTSHLFEASNKAPGEVRVNSARSKTIIRKKSD